MRPFFTIFNSNTGLTFSILLLFSFNFNSNATTYYTAANGTPSTLANWWTATNGTGTHPANFTTAGDIFEIQNGHTMTTTANWTVTGTVLIDSGGKLAVTSTGTTMNFGSLTISSGGTLTENRSLTVTGVTTISGTISFASTSTNSRLMTFTGNLTLNNGAIWNVPATGNGANDTFNFGGNFINNATSFNDLGTGVHTFSGAAKTISGSTTTAIGKVTITGTITNTSILTVNTTLAGAGNLTNGNGTTGTLNIGGTTTITTLTATASNNLVNYKGAAQTAKVTTYNNLTISGTGAKTFATTPTVNGILSMEATGTITITTGVVTYGSSATLQYNKPASYTATVKEWVSPFVASGGIVIKNTGAITTPGVVQIGNNTSVPLNINSGATLTPGANLIALHGDFINAGTLTSGSGGITIGGTVTTQTISGFTTTGTVSLTKTAGTATLQGNVNAGPFIINGSGGTLHLGTSLIHTFTGDISLTAGTLNGGSSILNVNNISATAWNGTGSVFSASTGTVNFGAAGAQTLSSTSSTFNNLTVLNSGVKTFTNTPSVNGLLSIEGTATVSAAPTYGSAATLQYNVSTSRTVGAEWITPFVASGGVIIANTGIITMNAAKVFNSTAPLTINSGSSLSMATYLLTLNGNLINNGTATGTTGGVTITGTATQTIGAFTTTGAVSMTKTGGTATLTGNINGAGLIINGSGGTLNLGVGLTHTFTGDVTLTAGSLNGGGSILNENNSSTTAWNGTGSIYTANAGTISFGATGNQTIVANSIFFNIILSGSGNKIFSNATTINNDLSISGSALADLGSGGSVHNAKSLTLNGTIQVSGTWGGTAASPSHVNNTYFLSTSSRAININCSAPIAPTSGGNQTICAGQTIPALTVTVAAGTTNWYSATAGGTLLASSSLTYTPSAAGTYYAETSSSGCISPTRTAVLLTVNSLPTLLSLTANTICTSPAGNGSITSTTSQSGVNYQLYNASNVAIQSSKVGTGASLSWTGLSAGNGYYIKGTNTTTSCYSNSSPINISTYANPTSLVLSGSTICANPGGDGIIISTTSEVGLNYQLYDGGNNPIQLTLAGTGNAIAWSNINAGSGYYAIGTDASSSCVSTNSNTVSIATIANPTDLVLTGSTICVSPGNNGTITSTSSQSGVDYQLFDNTDTEVGNPISGTGSGLTWSGLATGLGFYVVGTNTTSSCSTNNSNAVNISTSPNPTITSSASATAICFSTSAQSTTLAFSATTNSPTNYSIVWNTAAHTAGLVDLTSATITSSPLNIPIAANAANGTYTGTLFVASGSCSSIGYSFTVTINAIPSTPTGTATQLLCSGSTISNLTATGTAILWYSASSGGSALTTSTTLSNGTHYYASQTVSGCESISRLNVTTNIISSGSWMGTTSTNWFTTSNWCGGTIPTASTDVTIAAGLTNYPSIGTTGAVCKNITIASGASLTITDTNTFTVSGDWTNNGTFTANSSTIVFNGSGNANIGTDTFYNVTFSGSGTKTATGIMTIGGNVSISNNFTAGSYTHKVAGNWTNSGTFTATGSTIDFNGTVTSNIGTSNFNNITLSGLGTKTATGVLSIAGNITISNNFTAGSYTHTVGGNWTKSGTFTATGSTINFNGSGSGNIGASNFNAIIFSGSGTKTATGVLNILGNLTISNNFNAGSFSHSLQGNWTNNGTFTAGTSTFSFIGSSAQAINGSSSTTFKNLIQNGLGVIDLGIATTISGTMTLTYGIIDLHTYDLTITSTGSISGGSTTTYVKTSSTGRLKQNVAGFGSVTKNYPIGNSAYNPMSVKYNDVNPSGNFSLRVEDGAVTNANSSKTINRKWYLIKDTAGSADLTLTATYNSGEEGSGFNNSSSPQIGYFDGDSWAYRPITSGTGTTSFTASGSAPDFTKSSGYFVLGSDDAFNATKLVVTNINPTNPTLGIASAVVTVQAQNSNNVPTMVTSTTSFDFSCSNTTMTPSTPTGTINQYEYQTTVASIDFTTSTNNNHNATVTATRTSGDTLSAGTSAVFDVIPGTIWEPIATENWNATNGWKKSIDGGSSWINPATLPTSNAFADTDLIRIPSGITVTANVTASFYSMVINGTLDINSSGNLTLTHTSFDGYNIQVFGTLKNSGGILTNNNSSHPTELIEVNGGTYWHNMNGGSIPICNWNSLNGTQSTCIVSGITSTALTDGLNQIFEKFTWNNASQSVTQNLSSDLTVNGALTLTAGIITTGSYHVITGLAGTTSNSGAGWINGTLRRYVASSVTTGYFPVGDANYYAPFAIAVNTGTPSGNGYIDVSTTAAQPALESGLSQTKYINRKWTVSNNGVGGITSYNPSCTFDNGDKVGGPTTASLKLRKFTSSVWFITNGAATGNTITATGLSTAGLTATSDFYIAEDDCNSSNATWLGSTSTDWNTASNWCSGSVPTATTDVIIPSSPARQPVIGSAGGACKNITIQSGASLSVSGTYSLVVKNNWTNSGTFTAATSTVSFTGTTAQIISGATSFYNLTINNTAGVSAGNDITVNGILALTSANPNATHGTLDMGSYTLNILNENATVTGNGDVTGIIKRTHTFTPNVQYQFGSNYTTLSFFGIGTQPNEMSCKISIGSAPTWKTTAVQRYYSFAQTSTTGTDITNLILRYLPSELNGNDNDKLVLWDYDTGSAEEQGKTNNSETNYWVGLSSLSVNYVAPTALNDKYFGLANYSSTKNTWSGSDLTYPTKWNTVANWSAGHVPLSTEDVLIPSGKSHYPILTLSVEVKSLEIDAGASLTAGTNNVTINGSTTAFQNDGNYNGGTGNLYLTHGVANEIVTVSGAGTNQFHNIIIAANTFIRPEDGFYMKINGYVFAQLTSVVDLSANNNTVEYNGSNQIIVNPSHLGYRGYHNLIISGSGTSTLYDNTLNLAGDFTTNGTLNLSSGSVTFSGNSAQTIYQTDSVASIEINNLTISSLGGVTAVNDITVNGILNLNAANPTATKGLLEMTHNYGTYPEATNTDYLDSFILTMGDTATTIGIGDVTGTIKRNTILENTPYTFGNQFTTFELSPGTMPTAVSFTVTIGNTVPGVPAGIKRTYEIVPTVPDGFTSTSHMNVNFHYQDSELTSSISPYHVNTESKLVTGDRDFVSGNQPDEHGRSNYDFTNNYIGFSNVPISYVIKEPTSHNWRTVFTIHDYSENHYTWSGALSSNWYVPENWNPIGNPSSSSFITIPDAASTPNTATLPTGTTTVNTMTIENGGVLIMGDNTLEIQNSLSGGWEDQNQTSNDPGTSTVVFLNPGATISGNASFYNFTIADGADVTNQENNTMNIANTVTLNGTAIWNADIYNTTVEFNGTETQTIPAINYNNLIISGTRTSNDVTFDSSGTIGIKGVFTPYASFTTGNYITTSSTISYIGTSGTQNISQPFSFNNLTLNNSSGLSLSADATILDTLTFTNGKIVTGTNKIIIGKDTPICASGNVVGADTGKYVYGNLRRFVPNGTDATVDYPIGDETHYAPISIAFTGTTSGCGYLDASTVTSQPPVASGLSQTKYINRKWVLHNTGVTGYTSCTPTFTFVASDKIGSPNTSALVVRKYNGAAWSTTIAGTRASLSTQSTTSLSNSNEFVIGESDCGGTILWLGDTSTDWNDATNWCGDSVPIATDNIIIQPGTQHQPHIGSSDGVCKDITIQSGATLTMDGSYNLTVAGNWSNSGTFTESTSTVNFSGSGSQTISGSNTFSTLKINNATGVTLNAATTVTTLTIGDETTNSVFNDGGYQITSTGTLNLTSGTFKIGNSTTATSYPEFTTNTISSGTTVDYGSSSEQTIAAVYYDNLSNTGNGQRILASTGTVGIAASFAMGSGSYIVTGSTVEFNGQNSQTINGITYNNLTISGSGNNLKVAEGDITVNGVLDLTSDNYSTTKGALHMGQIPEPVYTLYMGANATTVGTGDVTGYVNRSSFVLGTNYTFGNQFTLMNFSVGPVPNSVTLELYLTDTDVSWKPDAVHRYYDIYQIGGSAATRLRFNIHYLDSELNGAGENNLDLFDHHVSSDVTHDHGFYDRDTTDNWVGFQNIGIVFLGNATANTHFWTLGDNITNNTCTWIGGSPSGTTDWNLPGNWEGGVPISTSKVIIPDVTYDPILPTGTTSIEDLTIQGNGVLTTQADTNLVLNSSLVNDGSFILENNANLFQNTAVSNTGNIEVRRNSSALKRLDYTLWSSPVNNQKLLAFSPLTLANRFYTYDSTQNYYTSISPTTNFEDAVGYLIRVPNNFSATTPTVWNGSFIGVPHNGDYTYSMYVGDETHCFNLVGNPYPSPISMSGFVSDNSSDITGTLYFWRKTNDPTKPSYCSWADDTFVTNNEDEVYDPNGIIRTGQGFFVEAVSGGSSVTFHNSQRVLNTDNQFFRNAQTTERNRIWLNITNTGGTFSQMEVGYVTGASQGIDSHDGKFLNDGATDFYSVVAGKKFVIQGRALPFVADDVVPLGYKTSTAGSYSISLDHMDGFFLDFQEILLRDLTTNTIHNLKSGPYTFVSNIGTFDNRFEILYTMPLGIHNPLFNENQVVVYKINDDLVINSGTAIMQSVKVFDVSGRLLTEKNAINNSEIRIKTAYANEVLFIQIIDINGSKVIKKMIF